MDQAMRAAVKIEAEMLNKIEAAHQGILQPVLHKHKEMLKKLGRLMQAGETARARVLWRKSGIIDDIAQAIASAGRASSDAIREGLGQIREVVTHDTG